MGLLHTDLLKQARFLAENEPKKPKQASLRRSVSASYYALFHLLIDEATKLMLSGQKRACLRDCLARAFNHSTMKNFAKSISDSNNNYTPKNPVSKPPQKFASAFNGQPVSQKLIDVASSFVQLQQARHEADYNRAFRFTRKEVLDLVDTTEQSFKDWKEIRKDNQADIFLTGLLVYKQIQM